MSAATPIAAVSNKHAYLDGPTVPDMLHAGRDSAFFVSSGPQLGETPARRGSTLLRCLGNLVWGEE